MKEINSTKKGGYVLLVTVAIVIAILIFGTINNKTDTSIFSIHSFSYLNWNMQLIVCTSLAGIVLVFFNRIKYYKAATVAIMIDLIIAMMSDGIVSNLIQIFISLLASYMIIQEIKQFNKELGKATLSPHDNIRRR